MTQRRCCFDDCCKDELPPIHHAERMPAFIDVTDWLDCIQATGINQNCVEVTVTGGDVVEGYEALNVHDIKVDRKYLDDGCAKTFLEIWLAGGTPGCGYQVNILVETCEGHRGHYCFKQYIKAC